MVSAGSWTIDKGLEMEAGNEELRRSRLKTARLNSKKEVWMTEDEPIAVVVVGTRLPSERLGMPIKQAGVPPLNVSKAKSDDGAWYEALKYPIGMGCMASLGEQFPPSAKAKAVCHSFCLISDLICLAISDPIFFPLSLSSFICSVIPDPCD